MKRSVIIIFLVILFTIFFMPGYVKYSIGILLILLLFIYIFSRGYIYPKNQLSYGVTFSKKEAEDLGLNWKQTYTAILNDLGVRKLRLSAYWDEVEATSSVYDWTDLDWQLGEARQAGASVILAVGGRLPRWPECHFPAWVDKLSTAEREQKQLEYIQATVLRYIGDKEIVAWQVENEPFLPNFGECPKLDSSFLDKEIALVKSLDDRPIVITDSGELSVWIPAASRADIFGTSMYRDTYSRVLHSYIHYPITPGFFRFKKNIVSLFAHPQKWIVIELQAEPWGPIPFQDMTAAERDRTMNPQKFKEIIEYARQAGFNEFYLWGAEYWYWEKTVKGDSGMWDIAKGLFSGKPVN